VTVRRNQPDREREAQASVASARRTRGLLIGRAVPPRGRRRRRSTSTPTGNASRLGANSKGAQHAHFARTGAEDEHGHKCSASWLTCEPNSDAVWPAHGFKKSVGRHKSDLPKLLLPYGLTNPAEA
jgi:hypothetical protein